MRHPRPWIALVLVGLGQRGVQRDPGSPGAARRRTRAAPSTRPRPRTIAPDGRRCGAPDARARPRRRGDAAARLRRARRAASPDADAEVTYSALGSGRRGEHVGVLQHDRRGQARAGLRRRDVRRAVRLPCARDDGRRRAPRHDGDGGFQDVSSWSAFDVATLPGARARAASAARRSTAATSTSSLTRWEGSRAASSCGSIPTRRLRSRGVVGHVRHVDARRRRGTRRRRASRAPGPTAATSTSSRTTTASPDGRVVRYDTSRSASAPSLDAGRPDAGDAAPAMRRADAASTQADAGRSSRDRSATRRSGQTFDVSAAHPGRSGVRRRGVRRARRSTSFRPPTGASATTGAAGSRPASRPTQASRPPARGPRST